jgi:transcriptional antiterminator RfaH
MSEVLANSQTEDLEHIASFVDTFRIMAQPLLVSGDNVGLNFLTGCRNMKVENPVWICARTKAKHEHIAAANLRKQLGVEVFLPRLQIERITRRGLVRVSEPLFPCYIFVRSVLQEGLTQIQRVSGVNSVVHFGNNIPQIPDSVIADLRHFFNHDESLKVDNRFYPGDEVVFASGAFNGMHALVLREMPTRKRIQVLLDVLGRSIPVEVSSNTITKSRKSLADLVPLLAATQVGIVASSN